MQKPQVFLDNHPGEISYISDTCLIGSFDYPLYEGRDVSVDIFCEADQFSILGVVANVKNHKEKYVATIFWKDKKNQARLDHFLEASSRPSKISDVALEAIVEVDFAQRRRKIFTAIFVFSVFSLIFVAHSLWQTFFRVYIDPPFASVTAPVYFSSAPESGRFVLQAPLHPSDILKKGQVLGVLESPALEEKKTRLKNDFSFVQAQADILKQKKQQLIGALAYRQKITEDEVRQKEERLSAVQAGYLQASQYQKRMLRLHRKGYISQAKWDDTVAATNQAKSERDEAVASLDQKKTESSMAEEYFVYGSTRNLLADTPQDLDREIAENALHYENLLREQQVLKKRLDGLTMISPCDCRVIDVKNDRIWVNQGDALIRLQDNAPQTLMVEARLPAYIADRVQVGDVAKVTIGDHGDSLPAKVVDIRAVVGSGDRYGLSPLVTQDPVLTSVYLQPLDASLLFDSVGVHATVSIRTFERSFLYQWLSPTFSKNTTKYIAQK